MTTDPVEIGAKALCDVPSLGHKFEDGPDDDKDTFRYLMRKAITALEAAGYRIAGPEPTEEMQTVAPFARTLADKVWREMWAKLPLYGSE